MSEGQGHSFIFLCTVCGDKQNIKK